MSIRNTKFVRRIENSDVESRVAWHLLHSLQSILMVARLGKVVGWTVAGAAIVLSSAAIFLVVTSADPILSKSERYLILVTWFFYNQSPINYQTEFPSAEACQAVKHDLLYEEIRLRQESEDREKKEQARGVIRGAIPTPTVSVVCAKK
jgi:hypothetical protein